jgi:hypothetical protein
MIDLQYADVVAVETEPAPREELPLPGHLIRARPGGLAYWRCVGLRAAGFPIDDALRLAAPEAAETADGLIRAERRAEEANAALLAAINAALDALRDEGRWEQAELRNPLMDARSRVKAGKLPNGELPPEIAARVAEARAAREGLAPARAEYDRGHAAALRRTSAVLREIAGSDRLREAITWQNRQALHTALDPLLNAPEDARGSRHRQHESLLASYVQRYCVKNDTIGFFGPVGWAEFVDEGAPVVSRPGPGLVATRRTYFEMWGIEALAAWISGEESFRPWLKPLPNPAVRVEGTTLHHPVYGSLSIPVVDAVALSMCDGNRTARDVAKVLLRLPKSPLKTEGDVYRHLQDLEHRGLLRYSIYVPYDAYPERALRSWLEGIGDEAPRREGLARLDALEAARARVSAATGTWREAGGMYAARTLVYEDCRRDGEVKLGPDLLRALDEPLSLMMRSARWLTVECAAICMAVVRELYEELVRTGGSPVVDASRFWLQLTDLFTRRGSGVFDEALQELKRRWDELLPSDPSQRRVFASAEELRPRVEAAFPATAPGWRMARYHSPDVMIAAAGPDAIARGEFQLVMGECHLSANTLAVSLFVNQHPSPPSLVEATEWDLDGTHVVPVEPKNIGDFTARTARALVSPQALRLEWSRDSLATRDSRRLRVSTLVVEDVDGELMARSRDGAHEFPLMDLISEPLSGIFTHSFGVLTEGRYVPRRTIDRLVVSRETWRFSPDELGFAFEKKEADRFLGLRRWARAHGLPRFVFTKVPVERKPCYIDLDSAIYAEAFAKLVRRSAEQGDPGDLVTVSEMLPGPDELWLADAEGRPHVSELRIVLVDTGEGNDPADAPGA